MRQLLFFLLGAIVVLFPVPVVPQEFVWPAVFELRGTISRQDTSEAVFEVKEIYRIVQRHAEERVEPMLSDSDNSPATVIFSCETKDSSRETKDRQSDSDTRIEVGDRIVLDWQRLGSKGGAYFKKTAHLEFALDETGWKRRCVNRTTGAPRSLRLAAVFWDQANQLEAKSLVVISKEQQWARKFLKPEDKFKAKEFYWSIRVSWDPDYYATAKGSTTVDLRPHEELSKEEQRRRRTGQSESATSEPEESEEAEGR